ncbi:haloacid dehalogenase, partial [Candidatus Bathyarchaeota archaeon]
QWEKIIRLGLHHFFDIVVISEEVGSEKPDTKIFEVALKKLNIEPYEAVYVGDNLETDILGANKAGMISIRILKGKHKEGKPAGKMMKPRYSIKKLSDLLSILKKLDR